jgi:hypothetical protein
MPSYKLTLGNTVQRLDDGAFVPIDPSSQDYADYLAWIAAGNTAQPVDPPTAEQVAVAARNAIDAAEAASVKADSQVVTFLNFTPVQLDAWIDTNIGTAATLVAVRTACVVAFKVLGRIALAAGRGRSLR